MAAKTKTTRIVSIPGVLWQPLTRHEDSRGWLTELFRQDELPADCRPAMGYVSATKPGVTRGPHEHREQADCFCFIGPSRFRVYLWDNRPESPTFRDFQTQIVGSRRPMLVVVPPGVVHAYKNIGDKLGLVYNFPNRLYRGPDRREEVDEIRHEEDLFSPFRVP